MGTYALRRGQPRRRRHLRHSFLQTAGIWPDPPAGRPFLISCLRGAGLAADRDPARGGHRVLLTVEGVNVALILLVSVVVLVT